MLQELRQEVFDQTDYDPERAEHRQFVDRELNKAYQHVAQRHVWPWACVYDTPVDIYADVTTENTVLTNGSRVVTDADGPFTSDMVGRLLVLDDEAEHEYTILEYTSANQVYLDRVFTGTTDTYAVTIQDRIIVLPQDLSRLLYVVCRDEQEVYYQSDTKVAGLVYLDQSSTSVPQFWVPQGIRTTRPPVYAPELAAGGGAGTVTDGTYEICYTFTRLGVESAPSKAAQVTVAAPNARITVTVPDMGVGSGYQKNIYVRRVYDDQETAFRLAATVDATTTSSVFITPFETDWIVFEAPRLGRVRGSAQTIKFDQRQDTDRRIQLSYLRKIDDLVEDQDTPLFDDAHNPTIVQRAVMAVTRRNQQWSLYGAAKNEVEDADTAMAARYLTEEPATVQVGPMFGRRSWHGFHPVPCFYETVVPE